MGKFTVFAGMILFLAASICIAQEESLTITTYYPSPNAVFNELQAYKLKVGNITETLEDGQVYVERSVIYKPLSVSSLSCSSATEGELVYNDSDNSFYLCNGTDWVKQ